MARKGLTDRYRPQAEAEAFLRFNPERRSLAALLQAAKAGLQQDIRSARGTRRGMVQAIDAVRPQVSESYGQAAGRLENAFGDFHAPSQGSIAEQLARVGPEAGAIVAAALGEQSLARGRVSEAEAQELAGLRDQRLQARAGEAAAVTSARSRYRSEEAKVLDQLRALGVEEGVFTAASLGKLVEGARGRAVTKRGQDKAAEGRARAADDSYLQKYGMTRDEFLALPQGQRDKLVAKSRSGRGPGAADWQSPAKQESFASSVSKAIREARDLKGAGSNRHEAAGLLLSGIEDEKSKPVYDPQTGKKVINPDGTAKMTPAVPGFKPFDELVARVALDMEFDGELSRATVRLLHKRGYKVNRLGFPTRTQNLRGKVKKPSDRSGRQAPGANGQVRPT